MRKTIVTVLLLCCAFFAFADGIKWLDNYPKAQEEAKKTGKPILMLFTGSDWCGYCIKMDKYAFSKPGFQKMIQENFIPFMADFPSKKKLQPGVVAQNENLQTKYQIRGYPTVLISNAKGEILAKTGFIDGNEKAYINAYQKILKDIKK